MTKATSFIVALVAVAAVTAGCGFEHSQSVLEPSPANAGAPTTTAAGTPSLVGIWGSNTFNPASLPDPNTCGNFQFQVASQTATSISGTFMGQCAGGIVLSGSASGQLTGTAVTITANGSGTGLPGIPSCTFSLTANGNVEDNGYTLPLSFTGTTCLGPVHGSEVLRRPSPTAAPPPPPTVPEPAPAPPPPPAPAPAPADILQGAAIYGGSAADVANWPVTARITALDFNSSGVRVDFTRKDGPGRWPDVVPPGWDGPLQYTIWMVVNHNGRWVTSGGVEYWYGLERQGGPPSQFAANWYYNPLIWGPLASHQPAPGEQVGFFVTAGDQRAKDVSPVRERSNVVVIPFPNGGGYYGF